MNEPDPNPDYHQAIKSLMAHHKTLDGRGSKFWKKKTEDRVTDLLLDCPNARQADGECKFCSELIE